MAYLLDGCQLFIAFVLFIAAMGKILYPQQFIRALQASAIPLHLLRFCALSTIVIEIALAIELIFPWSLLVSWVGVIVLLSIFTSWLYWMYARKISLHCGCFGPARSSINEKNIIRNLVFVGIAVLGLFLTFHTPGLFPSVPLWGFIVTLVLAGGMVPLMIWRLHPSLRKRRRLSSSQTA